MGKIAKRISVNDMLDILNNQWLSSTDIKKLACVSLARAIKIKDEITADLTSKNYFVPSGVVPCDSVVKYLNLNINYLKKISEKR